MGKPVFQEMMEIQVVPFQPVVIALIWVLFLNLALLAQVALLVVIRFLLEIISHSYPNRNALIFTMHTFKFCEIKRYCNAY